MNDVLSEIDIPEDYYYIVSIDGAGEYDEPRIFLSFVSTTKLKTKEIESFIEKIRTSHPSQFLLNIITSFEELFSQLHQSVIGLFDSGISYWYQNGIYSLLQGKTFYDMYSVFDFLKWKIEEFCFLSPNVAYIVKSELNPEANLNFILGYPHPKDPNYQKIRPYLHICLLQTIEKLKHIPLVAIYNVIREKVIGKLES